jgi:transketolase
MLIYALLHLTGYEAPTMDDRSFRQMTSPAPAPGFLLEGVECTTGPLGQGLAMAVGMAMAGAISTPRSAMTWSTTDRVVAAMAA